MRSPARTDQSLRTLAAAAALASALASGPAQAVTMELEPWHDGALPNFTLPAADGRDIALETGRGRVVLVHFFATWCEPCQDELPALRRFAQRAASDPIVVMAISVAEVDLRVRRFLETMPLNFPVLLDRDRAVAKAWNISALPSTVILDRTLAPRLVAQTDVAWDRIDPRALVDTLGAARIPKSSPSPTGSNDR
ncbi:MAG TPA: TlpA disulfide reductase family protein [Xanthobacteraceae bacterium]|nr:TlpA disulfide reductase family protein [Xanthobacteraceae bacterium]